MQHRFTGAKVAYGSVSRLSGVLAAMVLSGALHATSATAQPVPSAPASLPAKWGPHIDLEGKLGSERHIGEADVFYPLWQNGATMLFGNLKARLDDNASREGNYGLGLRHMLENGWNLGTYGYFDRRRTEHHNYFNQITAGVEALSLDWDFRANAYIPEGRRSHPVDSLNTAKFEGTTVVFRGGEERSLRGFDIEAGWRVPVFDGTDSKQIRIYGGGYRFYADSVNPVQGPRGRAEMVFDEIPELWEGSRLAVGAEMQHDAPRGATTFVSMRLRIPLQIFGSGGSPSRLTPMERRMTDPVVRDIDVVAQAGSFGAPETATQFASGATFSVINSASTSGAALPGAVTALANNSTVILAGTFNTTASVNLTGNKSLMAGTMTVRSPSGRLATLNTPAATISSSDAVTTTIQATGNNTISGLTIIGTDTGGGAQGIAMSSGAGNINILNNTITVTQTGPNSVVGITADNNANVVVSGNTITVTGFAGQAARAVNLNTATTVTVSGNALSASGGLNNFALDITGTTINTAGSAGNVLVLGTCTGAPTSGSVSFANGTTCP